MRHCKIHRLFVHLLILGFVFLPAVGSALDLTLEPRIQAGVMDYEFEQKAIAGDAEGVRFTDHGYKIVSAMPFMGGGMTLFANRFFVDFYLQKAFSVSDSATNPLEYRDFDATLNLIINSDFERDESSMSFGYALGNHWVLFGGYRASKTDFNETVTIAENINGNRISGSGKRNTAFKQDGFFIGGAFAFSFREHAVITLNAALATLDGKYNSLGDIEVVVTDSNNEVLSSGESPVGVNFDGDTVGLNMGAAWKGRIAERLSYTLGVNGYSYDFDAKEKDVADLSESVFRFSAGLSYQF